MKILAHSDTFCLWSFNDGMHQWSSDETISIFRGSSIDLYFSISSSAQFHGACYQVTDGFRYLPVVRFLYKQQSATVQFSFHGAFPLWRTPAGSCEGWLEVRQGTGRAWEAPSDTSIAACTHHDHDDQYYQINIAWSFKHQYEYCQSETLGPSGPD